MSEAVYPSYMNLDPFIDVDQLTALDAFISGRLQTRLNSTQDRQFYTGPFLLKPDAPDKPGTRMVYLSRSREPDDYYDLDRTELWEPTPDAEEFGPLMAFIDTLPFKATARMLIMYDPDGRAVSAHKDHDSQDLCHEFIWFRTNRRKPFYMLNPQTGEQLYVDSHAAWFDTVNQFHGADATGELAFSVRVDGVFDDAFRKHIPWPRTGRAAAAAYWANASNL